MTFRKLSKLPEAELSSAQLKTCAAKKQMRDNPFVPAGETLQLKRCQA